MENSWLENGESRQICLSLSLLFSFSTYNTYGHMRSGKGAADVL